MIVVLFDKLNLNYYLEYFSSLARYFLLTFSYQEEAQHLLVLPLYLVCSRFVTTL